MGRALASPAASTADNPAAPRTPASCQRSSDQSQSAALLPACLVPQSGPHVVPLRIVPRLSSLALARIRQRLSNCRIFTPAQPTHSVASSEGFLLRRLHADLLQRRSSHTVRYSYSRDCKSAQITRPQTLEDLLLSYSNRIGPSVPPAVGA